MCICVLICGVFLSLFRVVPELNKPPLSRLLFSSLSLFLLPIVFSSTLSSTFPLVTHNPLFHLHSIDNHLPLLFSSSFTSSFTSSFHLSFGIAIHLSLTSLFLFTLSIICHGEKQVPSYPCQSKAYLPSSTRLQQLSL